MPESSLAAIARLVAKFVVTAWRSLPGSGKAWLPAVLFALAGLGAVGASTLPGPGVDDGWTRDLLMTIGASLALFAPFYLITRTLDGHLDKVVTETRQDVEDVRTEAAAATAAVQSKVETLQADVERKLSDVAKQVSARLQEEAQADARAFAALRTDATRDVVLEALERADRLGLTALKRPPRVNVGRSSRLYVSAQFDPGEMARAPLLLRIEETDGVVRDWFEWSLGQDVADIMVEIGLAVRRHIGEDFAIEGLFHGLADLLEAALTNLERRPAVEMCPPQWMICDWGVVTYGRSLYGVSLDNLWTSESIVQHVQEKPWVDADSWEDAASVAVELFPAPGSMVAAVRDHDRARDEPLF